MPDWLFSLDAGALLWIQEHLRAPAGDAVLSLYTRLGDSGLLFLCAAALLLCFKRTRWAGIAAGCAMLLGFLCTNAALKRLFTRPRPWLDVAGLIPLVHEPDPNSFPSGHATSSFAFAGALLWTAPMGWLKGAALAAAALMAFSRLYVGVHYPTDVLCGAAIGLLCGFLAWRICRLARERWTRPRSPR